MAKKHLFVAPALVQKMPGLRHVIWLLEAFIVKSLAALVRAMPTERAYAFASALFRSLSSRLQFAAIIRRNLSIAFPQKSAPGIARLARAVCANLGRAAVDLLLAGRIWEEREKHLEFVMEEGMDLARYHDRAAVLVTGHIGAWQISTFVAAQYGIDMTAIHAPEQNPYLKDFYARSRKALPVQFISRDGCMRGLIKQLKSGHAVALTADTRIDTGEWIDFFGKPMRANTSAARLALHNQCDLIPVRVERLQGCRFRVTVCKPIRPDDEAAPLAEQATQMTASLLRHFEAWIRSNPEQWMCFSRRWPREAYAD